MSEFVCTGSLCVLQLLDHCCTSSTVAYPRKNPTIRPVPKRLFDRIGKEIKSVFELEYDHEIWLSFGEPWRSPYSKLVFMDAVNCDETN